MKNIKRKRIPPSTNKLFPILILVATLFMGVGYASINSVSLNINGEVVAKAQDGIYITEVNYVSDVNANLDESKIISAYQTALDSNVSLSNIDNKSSITYEVKIYNSNDVDYYFDKVDYLIGDDTYSNLGIIFELNGIKNNQKVSSKSYVTFNITFSYENDTLSNSNILKSLLNFKFRNFACPEDGRVCDLSGNGNHGTLNGATMNTSTSTLYTDGIDDFVDCGLANYNFNKSISYVLRFKVLSWTEKNYWEFFGNWEDAGGGIRINENKSFGVSLNINNKYYVPKSDTYAELDKWYTIVITFDGEKIILYIDGEKDTVMDVTGSITTSKLPFYIGANPDIDSSSYHTNLTVDYALLFDRVLTENEVANDYLDKTIISNEKNLLLYYEFE